MNVYNLCTLASLHQAKSRNLNPLLLLLLLVDQIQKSNSSKLWSFRKVFYLRHSCKYFQLVPVINDLFYIIAAILHVL